MAELMFLALVLSTTSVGIVVPTLKERGVTAGAFGQIVLACAMLADLVTMIGVSILAAWIAGGDVVRSALPLAFVLVATLIAVAITRLARRDALVALFRRLDTPLRRASAPNSCSPLLSPVSPSAR